MYDAELKKAVVSTFYKSIPFQAAYDIYLAADDESTIPDKIQEKIHKRKFAHLLNAEEKAKLDKDREPYFAELKRAEEKKSAALWKKVEANAKIPKGVPADIREFETIFAGKRGSCD